MGIRHNRISEQTMMSVRDLLEFLGRYWWALVPLPPLVWLALLPLARRWDRCRRDPVYARAMAALWRFRRTAWHDEETAWRHYLADRLALCAEALTADTVAEALRARKVDVKLVAETRRRFEERDAADYGRRPAAPVRIDPQFGATPAQGHRPVVAGVRPLGPVARRDAAESPDELFARALRMRGEKPDEAQPLFVEAALRFESEARFLNAGNGWFFAGESGRALANYRAAQRRWPFDGQLRESIEFLRANRADAFPSAATPSGTRRRFLEPVLHVGDGVARRFVCGGVSGRLDGLPGGATAGVADPPGGLGCVDRGGARAVGIGGSNQFPAGGGSCHRGRRRATRPWLRLRSRIPATTAQGRRVFLDGDPSRMGPRPAAGRLGRLAAGIRLYESRVNVEPKKSMAIPPTKKYRWPRPPTCARIEAERPSTWRPFHSGRRLARRGPMLVVSTPSTSTGRQSNRP